MAGISIYDRAAVPRHRLATVVRGGSVCGQKNLILSVATESTRRFRCRGINLSMKLIFCPLCQDVVRLHVTDEPRKCLCGRSWGRYRSPGAAEIGGKAVMLGMHNVSLLKAVGDRANTTEKLPIKAFVFPCVVDAENDKDSGQD